MRADQWLMLAVGGLGLYAVYHLVKGGEKTPSEHDTAIQVGDVVEVRASALPRFFSQRPDSTVSVHVSRAEPDSVFIAGHVVAVEGVAVPPVPSEVFQFPRSEVVSVQKPAPVAEPTAPTELPPFPQNRPPGEPLRPGTWFRGRLDLPAHLPPKAAPPNPKPLELAHGQTSREQLASELGKLGFANVEVYMTPEEATPQVLLPAALANPTPGTRWFTAQWPPSAPRRAIERPPQLTYLWFVTAPARPATGAIYRNPYYAPVWPGHAHARHHAPAPRSPYVPTRPRGPTPRSPFVPSRHRFVP